MSITIINPQSHEAWLQLRHGGIGSSEVATVIGLNPYESPYQLWRRKKGLDAPIPETFLMKVGHYLEDCVARLWADETGNEIIPESAQEWIIQCNEHPYMRVSPDRLYYIKGEPKDDLHKGILECKTTQHRIDPDKLPKHWFCQLQYQLGVAELRHGSLAWFVSGREFGHQSFTFQPDIFDFVKEEVTRFWVDNIEGGKEPEVMDVADIAAKFSTHKDGVFVDMPEDMLSDITELREVRDEIGVMEERKKMLEDKIKIAIGEAEGLTYQGATIATWKAGKPSSKFDAKRFADENPELAAKYTDTVPGIRRFILK